MLALAALVAVGAGAACSGGEDEQTGETAPNIVQPGAPGEPSRTLSADELQELEETTYTDADVLFMQAMIEHHGQAIRMTHVVPSRSSSRDVPLLAKRIDVSQKDEIELIRRWLEERGEKDLSQHDDGHHHEHSAIPGMIPEDELRRLESARGRAFDRLFLQLMIRHHEGAIAMVEDLYEIPRAGAEPDVAAFARHVESDQRIEISRMKSLLASLPA